MTIIRINSEQIETLDLTPISIVIASGQESDKLIAHEQQIKFEIDYIKTADDPRELSEIPEIRLWFIRLDTVYPWLPLLLDWKSGELARYTAMLVPHQFSRNEGIIYNPEALEIFVMQKLFVLSDCLKRQNMPKVSRLKSFTQLLGYDIDEEFLQNI